MKKTAVLALALLSLWSCKKKDDLDDDHHHEEEVITSVYLTLSDTAGNQYEAAFVDLDGPRGDAPSRMDSLVLDQYMSYQASLRILNESETPAEDIGAEILAEADEHFVCYEFGDLATFTVEYLDSDGTYPLGLVTNWESQPFGAMRDTVTIRVKHQPNGTKDGTCEPGETDVEVSFPIILQ